MWFPMRRVMKLTITSNTPRSFIIVKYSTANAAMMPSDAVFCMPPVMHALMSLSEKLPVYRPQAMGMSRMGTMNATIIECLPRASR